ncbi:MAG TPA: YncE family protein [Steroidobacteraceae bacterium]|nr:YncE family protein [Steroidobacteraceae bacterium]
MNRRHAIRTLLATSCLTLSAAGVHAAQTYAIAGKIAGPDGGWDYASYDSGAHKIYVSRTDGVMSIDVATKAVTGHLLHGSKARAVVALPALHRLLVTFGGDNATTIFDTEKSQVVATLPVPGSPDGAVLDPKTSDVYIMSKNGNVTVVDPAAARVKGHFTIGGELEAPAVDGQGKMFVNVADKSEIAVVDLQSQRVTAHYHLAGCEGPTGLAFIPNGRRLISVCDNGVADIVDADTGKAVGTLKIGAGPDAVILDIQRQLALVPSGDAGTLTVIDISSPQGAIKQQLKTEPAAATGALEPESGRLYLPTANFPPGPPPEHRADHLPGTFHVLVVEPR